MSITALLFVILFLEKECPDTAYAQAKQHQKHQRKFNRLFGKCNPPSGAILCPNPRQFTRDQP